MTAPPARSVSNRPAFAGCAASLLLLILVALLCSAAPAAAATVTDRPLLFGFDGHDATAGRFDPKNSGSGLGLSTIAVDDSTGAVYVAHDHYPTDGFVSKFNPDGTAANFAATGASSLWHVPGHPFLNLLGIAVDNSGGPNQGRLYVSDGYELNAFAPDGTRLWTIVPPFQASNVAVDTAGHVWLTPYSGSLSSSIEEYDNTGTPPAQIGSIAVNSAKSDVRRRQ